MAYLVWMGRISLSASFHYHNWVTIATSNPIGDMSEMAQTYRSNLAGTRSHMFAYDWRPWSLQWNPPEEPQVSDDNTQRPHSVCYRLVPMEQTIVLLCWKIRTTGLVPSKDYSVQWKKHVQMRPTAPSITDGRVHRVLSCWPPLDCPRHDWRSLGQSVTLSQSDTLSQPVTEPVGHTEHIRHRRERPSEKREVQWYQRRNESSLMVLVILLLCA